jgi:hypothetical protein
MFWRVTVPSEYLQVLTQLHSTSSQETQSSESTLLEGVRSANISLFVTPFLYLSWNVFDRSKRWGFLLVIFYVHKIVCSGVFLGGVIQQRWTRWHAAAQRCLHCQCAWAQLPVRKETVNTIFKCYCVFITSVLVRAQSPYWPGLFLWSLKTTWIQIKYKMTVTDRFGRICGVWSKQQHMVKVQVCWDIAQCWASAAFMLRFNIQHCLWTVCIETQELPAEWCWLRP